MIIKIKTSWLSDEFKETIGKVYNNGNGKEIKDLAIEYGIPQSTIRHWVGGKKKRAEKNKLKSESHSVLKKELIHHRKYDNYEEANREIIEFIEGWYNKRRIQKKLNWNTPLEYKKCS